MCGAACQLHTAERIDLDRALSAFVAAGEDGGRCEAAPFPQVRWVKQGIRAVTNRWTEGWSHRRVLRTGWRVDPGGGLRDWITLVPQGCRTWNVHELA